MMPRDMQETVDTICLALILILFAVLLGSILGCAAVETQPYWFQSPVPPRRDPPRVITVDRDIDCAGTSAIGCYDYATNTILIAARLAPWDRDCVLSHELRHAAGWLHDLDSMAFSSEINCGGE